MKPSLVIAVGQPLDHFSYLWTIHSKARAAGLFTDMCLVTEDGGWVRVHRAVMFPLFPQLAQLMKDGPNSEEDQIVILPGERIETVQQMVDLLYTGTCNITNHQESLEVSGLMKRMDCVVPVDHIVMLKSENAKLEVVDKFSVEQEAQVDTVRQLTGLVKSVSDVGAASLQFKALKTSIPEARVSDDQSLGTLALARDSCVAVTAGTGCGLSVQEMFKSRGSLTVTLAGRKVADAEEQNKFDLSVLGSVRDQFDGKEPDALQKVERLQDQELPAQNDSNSAPHVQDVALSESHLFSNGSAISTVDLGFSDTISDVEGLKEISHSIIIRPDNRKKYACDLCKTKSNHFEVAAHHYETKHHCYNT